MPVFTVILQKKINLYKNNVKNRRKKRFYGEYIISTYIILIYVLKTRRKRCWNQMKITDVRLRKVNSENRMKAVASVTFDNEFVIHDIKVIESQNGLFIAMPSRKTPNGEFKDIAHPINAETREKIQTAILEAYEAPETEAEAEGSAE